MLKIREIQIKIGSRIHAVIQTSLISLIISMIGISPLYGKNAEGSDKSGQYIEIYGKQNIEEINKKLNARFKNLDTHKIKTGILYDRVISFSNLEAYSGKRTSKPVTLDRWRQMETDV